MAGLRAADLEDGGWRMRLPLLIIVVALFTAVYVQREAIMELNWRQSLSVLRWSVPAAALVVPPPGRAVSQRNATAAVTELGLDAEPLPNFRAHAPWGGKDLDGKPVGRFWNATDLARALAVPSLPQLYPLAAKLARGERIVVAAVGSSITQDHGGCFQPSLDAVYAEVPHPHEGFYGRNRPLCRTRGWLSLFMSYVNATWPHPGHLLVNAGHGGAMVKAIVRGLCLEAELPRTADLVVIETMAVVDAPAAEQLVWRLFRHYLQRQPHPPAVVLLDPWRPSTVRGPRTPWDLGCRAAAGEGNDAAILQRCCADFASSFASDDPRRDETAHRALARHYGFTAVSTREFLAPFVQRQAWLELGMRHGECEFMFRVIKDFVHPNLSGKVLFGDFLWLALTAAAADEARAARGAGGVVLPEAPLFPGGHDVFAMRCYGHVEPQRGGGGGGAAVEGKLQIVANSGFDFALYVGDGATKRLKPGWTATRAGAYMDIVVDTVFDGSPLQQKGGVAAAAAPAATPPPMLPARGGRAAAKPSLEIMVAFLMSYEHMGVAEVSCVSGCACAPVEIDALQAEPTSVTRTAELAVTPSRLCVVRVKVLDKTSSGEHKFKVTQVVARARLVASP